MSEDGYGKPKDNPSLEAMLHGSWLSYGSLRQAIRDAYSAYDKGIRYSDLVVQEQQIQAFSMMGSQEQSQAWKAAPKSSKQPSSEITDSLLRLETITRGMLKQTAPTSDPYKTEELRLKIMQEIQLKGVAATEELLGQALQGRAILMTREQVGEELIQQLNDPKYNAAEIKAAFAAYAKTLVPDPKEFYTPDAMNPVQLKRLHLRVDYAIDPAKSNALAAPKNPQHVEALVHTMQVFAKESGMGAYAVTESVAGVLPEKLNAPMLAQEKTAKTDLSFENQVKMFQNKISGKHLNFAEVAGGLGVMEQTMCMDKDRNPIAEISDVQARARAQEAVLKLDLFLNEPASKAAFESQSHETNYGELCEVQSEMSSFAHQYGIEALIRAAQPVIESKRKQVKR